MHDLNDVAFFAAVVKYKGFSAAARALDVPKSTLSRRVSALENRLGIRLLERSTLHFRLTDAGSSYYQKARFILDELDAADRELALMRSTPAGIVRLSAPLSVVQNMMSLLLPPFLKKYPLIRVQIVARDQPVDLIQDKIDIAIRARCKFGNEMLTMRKLTSSYRILVASPDFAAENKIGGNDPKAISGLPFLSSNEKAERACYTLVGPSGRRETVTFEPKMWTTDFNLVREAAVAGLGVALLPVEAVMTDVEERKLVHVLPHWQSEKIIVHLVFAGQKSLTLSGRLLVDYLADQFQPVIRRYGIGPR